MTQASDVIVGTESGKLRGRLRGGIGTFLGIPFAAPPVGALRFRAPQPVPGWAGIRDALEYGPTAPQPARDSTLVPEPTSDGDAYLNLNIDTPGQMGDRLPVLVWIHGGGFFAGCNRSPWFRGDRFARDGVVVVSVSYRLGAEGFMPIPGAPPNRGVLDWIAALQWVRRNIAAFGGDPDNVTIAGQSAGAAACTYLLMIPRARGLFRRVIAMSGSIGFGLTQARAEEIGRDLSRTLGVAYDIAALAGCDPTRFIAAQADLTGPDASARRAPLSAVERFAHGLPFQPVIDGEIIVQSSADAVQAGVGSDIPVLLSATAEEFDFVTRGGEPATAEAELAGALALLGLTGETADAYRDLHRTLSPDALLGRAITDRMFRARAVQMAEARSAAPAATYLAEFRWKPQPPVADGLGACHCLDIPFAFDLLDAPQVDRIAGPNPPQALASRLHQAWVGFARSGEPGWPAYRAEGRHAMLLDAVAEAGSDPFAAERAIWAASSWAGG